MKQKYFCVRKVSWDALWHALYRISPGGRVTWDRVTEQEALSISKNLAYDQWDGEGPTQP